MYNAIMDLCMPWRDSGCIYRKKAFIFLYEFYSKKFNVIVEDGSDKYGNFNLSAARNNAVKKVNGDILIIIDACNYLSYEQIYDSVDAATKNHMLIKPFNFLGYLTEESTHRIYQGDEEKLNYKNITSWDLCSSHGGPVLDFGGSFVIKKISYQIIGGMNENFIGWGNEDREFCEISRNIFGQHIEVSGKNNHLYHPIPEGQTLSQNNKDLLYYVKNEGKRKNV
jgi:predicted glycosyltransferase involved in capsule biosynthesis